MKILGFLILLISLILSACTRLQPIYNYQKENIPEGLSLAQVKQSIIEAAENRDWTIKVINPHQLEATHSSRQHKAIVNILYSDSSYSIFYHGSENLNANNGKIHRKYNQWVRNLNADIQKKLNEKTDLKS